MMSLEVFLLGLLIVSTLTGLFTEAIKKWLDERGKKYYPNALAGYVAIGLSIAVGTVDDRQQQPKRNNSP